MNLYERFAQLFSAYRDNYIRIFNVLYPAKNSTGFTERNLSVNFAKAYETENPDAVTWYEFQFGGRNNLHYDAVIINPQKKEIIIVESKRFNNPGTKIKEVLSDIVRINRAVSDYSSEFADRIEKFAEYTIFGAILADVWSENRAKTAIWKSFQNQSFLDEFGSELPTNDQTHLSDSAYFTGDFPDVVSSTAIREDYHLLSLIWKLTEKA